jgi:glyoxylase-like metal-dependent hydrolase (beta-lactamase superfamily II)
MEISPGIYLIAGTVGGRPLQLFLLRGPERTVLLDTGCAPDPEQIIFPYLKGLGLAPTDVDLIINTHSDVDHCGGNASFKRAHAGVWLTCGEADRALVEDPQVMWARRYNSSAARHGLAYDEAGQKWIMDMLGEAQAVDFTWRGGETLRLGPDWVVEIHATPGHTPGHLTVFDPRSCTALMGDAAHGAVYLDTSGKPALCPTYVHVESYLATLEALGRLDAVTLAGCHWPVKRGPEVAAFLDESRRFVERAEQVLLAELDRRAEGATLGELIGAAGPQLGDWPRSVDIELMYALNGNLERLIDQGRVKASEGETPRRYWLA